MISEEQLETTRVENQPLDWVKVKIPRRRWETRPQLSQSINEKVNNDLIKHMEDKYKGENQPKSKPQKVMDPDTRAKTIQNMLSKGNLNIGVGPISSDRINRVEQLLLKRGILNKNEHPTTRKERTIKSLVKSWSAKYLLMNDRDWDNININNIIMAENSDILFINCKSQEDVTMFTSRAKNIPQDNTTDAPRLVMYVDRRATKRHKAIINIAKTLREQANNQIQTTIRVGKNDFLLRKRDKGDKTPWSEIPPLKLTQELPDFEVGTYTDIKETMELMNRELDNNEKDDEQLSREQIEELDQVIEDLSKENNKRERSQYSTDEQNLNKHLRNNTTQIETPDQYKIEADLESSQREGMNSTPHPSKSNENLDNKILSQSLTDEACRNNELTHFFSVPETPWEKMNVRKKQK